MTAAACRHACLPRALNPYLPSALTPYAPLPSCWCLQESGEALLDRLRGSKAAGGAPAAAAAATAVRELSPAEAAKDEGNKAFKRGDWQGAADHYSR